MTDPETPIVPEVNLELTPEEIEQFPTIESRKSLDAHTLYVGRGWCPAVTDTGTWCNERANHPDRPHRAPYLRPDQTITWVTW